MGLLFGPKLEGRRAGGFSGIQGIVSVKSRGPRANRVLFAAGMPHRMWIPGLCVPAVR